MLFINSYHLAENTAGGDKNTKKTFTNYEGYHFYRVQNQYKTVQKKAIFVHFCIGRILAKKLRNQLIYKLKGIKKPHIYCEVGGAAGSRTLVQTHSP